MIRDAVNLGFIKMVEVVENCWLDLKKIKFGSEMNTSTKMRQIEKFLAGVHKNECIITKQLLKAYI